MYDIKKRPLGIYEKALPNDFTWLEKMQAAKQAGFDYIEISIDESDERLARLDWSDEKIEEIRSYMKETGIIIPSMCLSGHRRFPFGSKNKEIRDKAFEIMEKGIILAQKLGVRVIQLATYDVYYEESDEETKALFLEGLKKSVEMASHAGVILAMEIMDTPFVGTILRAMHYIKEIRSPYFKIYPDMGNLTQFSADVESEFELGISETVAIHVKETNPGVFKCVPFGEGTVRFTDIFKKLKDLKANVLGGLMPGSIYSKDNKATVNSDVINRNGEKLLPKSVIVKHNKTHEYTTLDIKDCVDENGVVTIDTTNFDSYIYTITLVYEDEVDNYTSQFMFMFDNR